MTETATRSYTRKTPAEKAQAELLAAEARAAKAAKNLQAAEEAVEAARAEAERAERFVQHAANHPDLPQSVGSDG